VVKEVKQLPVGDGGPHIRVSEATVGGVYVKKKIFRVFKRIYKA